MPVIVVFTVSSSVQSISPSYKGYQTHNSPYSTCSWHKQLPHVIGVGPQWATTNVRQKATVVCEVRGSRSNKRLMYEPRDLVKAGRGR